MKVKVTTEQSRNWMTLSELPIAKRIADSLKEYDAKEIADAAAHCWLKHTERARMDSVVKVLSVSAEIGGNRRVNGYYEDGSGRLDVWMDATVETFDGFLKIGFYLSDAWSIGPDEFNKTFPGLTYSRYYTEHKAA